MARWWRIRLPVRETQVRSLIQEHPACHREAKPVLRSCWVCALESGSCSYWAHVPQLLEPEGPRACAPQQEEPLPWEAHLAQRDNSLRSSRGWAQPRKGQMYFFFKKSYCKNLTLSSPGCWLCDLCKAVSLECDAAAWSLQGRPSRKEKKDTKWGRARTQWNLQRRRTPRGRCRARIHSEPPDLQLWWVVCVTCGRSWFPSLWEAGATEGGDLMGAEGAAGLLLPQCKLEDKQQCECWPQPPVSHTDLPALNRIWWLLHFLLSNVLDVSCGPQ